MFIEPVYIILDLTLDPAPPNRADEESGIRERGTRAKDNSGPTLQITQKSNRAEGPYTHTILLQTHHTCSLAREPMSVIGITRPRRATCTLRRYNHHCSLP